MSALEETESARKSPPQPESKANATARPVSVLNSVLNLLSSVRLGVVLLVLLVLLSMAGMVIMQQNVEGFEKYYATLTPSQKLLRGSLGLFDVYHAWYFNLLLLTLSLNIVLASIDRFPKAWTFIKKKKLDASRHWLAGQQQSAVIRISDASADAQASRTAIVDRITRACRAVGMKATVTEKKGNTFVFAERGAWNRLGAYAVHVALLTIFTGGFLTAQFGKDGQMPLQPGTSASTMSSLSFSLDKISQVPEALPFTVTCTDIQQKLIEKDGPITANNTIDWLTRIKVKDETGEREALVHLNTPFDYRGYRFFQASFISLGRAREITLRLTPEGGGAPQEIKIPRDGSTTLADGTKITFDNFLPDFFIGEGGKPDTKSGDYNNPAAVLTVAGPNASPKRAYAFAMELTDGAPVGAAVAGYKYRLADFEKVPDAHVLAIQRDPGRTAFYVGGLGLIMTLGAVFFFSHQRVWAVVEENANGKTIEAGKYEVVIGGNTNRNKLGFEDRFRRLVSNIGGDVVKIGAPAKSKPAGPSPRKNSSDMTNSSTDKSPTDPDSSEV